DYDTSDRLFFEPLTAEDVIHICEAVKPRGVIVQLGGQTPLNIAASLEEAGVPIVGTSTKSIDLAEDRERFQALISRLGLRQPENGIATNGTEAIEIAGRIGFPVLVRPSYVLGGRAMEIVYSREDLERYMTLAVEASPERPVLVDKFLEEATEVDVDAISDGSLTLVCGVMEHIEEAGVHSGDSACALPPFSLKGETIDEIKRLPHRAVRLQGHRRAMGTGGRQGDGGDDARRTRRDKRGHPALCLGQGAGVSFQQVPPYRHNPWARDALDGRGHGDRR
ncbi:MAG: ATP-binding protein, partial [Planctomycetota bacterium]